MALLTAILDPCLLQYSITRGTAGIRNTNWEKKVKRGSVSGKE